MNELSILCFLSVADTHSFSNTARELTITQQAVSRYIQNLEEELGLTLLIRDQNLVTPTLAGKQLLHFFKNSNERFQEISAKTARLKHSIHIGISDWIGNARWIRETSLKFKNQHPEYTIIFYEISAYEAEKMARQQSLDCYLTTNYELENISVPHLKIQICQSSICVVHNKTKKICSCHFCSGAGEKDEMSIKARDMKLCRELGYSPTSFRVYPNNTSMLLNVSIGNGICFSPQCGKISENPLFHLKPTIKTADIVTGIFNQNALDILQTFSDIMRETLL